MDIQLQREPRDTGEVSAGVLGGGGDKPFSTARSERILPMTQELRTKAGPCLSGSLFIIGPASHTSQLSLDTEALGT